MGNQTGSITRCTFKAMIAHTRFFSMCVCFLQESGVEGQSAGMAVIRVMNNIMAGSAVAKVITIIQPFFRDTPFIKVSLKMDLLWVNEAALKTCRL